MDPVFAKAARTSQIFGTRKPAFARGKSQNQVEKCGIQGMSNGAITCEIKGIV